MSRDVDPWEPHKDVPAYVLPPILLILELPVLAVLWLVALVGRAVATVGERIRRRAGSK